MHIMDKEANPYSFTQSKSWTLGRFPHPDLKLLGLDEK